MRADSIRLLPRISTTVSVGTKTSVISFCRSVSRIRAFKLSRTFFSCPEYVCRMNHCCITKLFSSGEAQPPCYLANQPFQSRNEISHAQIDQKQVNRKKDHSDYCDDGRVLDVNESRPRNALHLSSHVVYK